MTTPITDRDPGDEREEQRDLDLGDERVAVEPRMLTCPIHQEHYEPPAMCLYCDLGEDCDD